MPQNSCKNADVCLSEFSSEEEDLSDKNTAVNQADLIFEYFESDLPPRRQPFFDKWVIFLFIYTSIDLSIFLVKELLLFEKFLQMFLFSYIY